MGGTTLKGDGEGGACAGWGVGTELCVDSREAGAVLPPAGGLARGVRAGRARCRCPSGPGWRGGDGGVPAREPGDGWGSWGWSSRRGEFGDRDWADRRLGALPARSRPCLLGRHRTAMRPEPGGAAFPLERDTHASWMGHASGSATSGGASEGSDRPRGRPPGLLGRWARREGCGFAWLPRGAG